MKCCICERYDKNPFGNSPFPVRKTGVCCDECNKEIVVPARLAMIENSANARADLMDRLTKMTYEELTEAFKK